MAAAVADGNPVRRVRAVVTVAITAEAAIKALAPSR